MAHYHFVGIGGTGLAPIARILIERGHAVSGSDRLLSPLADEIRSLGGKVSIGHDPSNVIGANVVIRSSAIHDDNVEIQSANNAGIRVLKRSEFLTELIGRKKCLAVAGTHGKTTTTAMLAWLLTSLDQDPSYVIGGTPLNLASSAHDGQGKYFVIEADEYDNMYHGLSPTLAIVTVLEHDHPDFFPTMDIYRQSFEQFVSQIIPGGNLITSADNREANALASKIRSGVRTHSFGKSTAAEYQANELRLNSLHCYDFNLARRTARSSERLVHVSLSIAGEHNVMNALAVLATIHILGLPMKQGAEALKTFKGTGRRFEVLGTAAGVTVIDDYGHHPTEISSTLSAARQKYPGQRIWAVWQPHTYTRTKTLENDFINAFTEADQVIVTEVYAARETENAYSSKALVERMTPGKAQFAATLPAATSLLKRKLVEGDVVIVLSAGDANQISREVYQSLVEKEKK